MYGNDDENEVISFSEYFDRSFVRMSKRVKYDSKSLYKFIDEEVKLNLFPIDRVLKNNISSNEEIFDLIKESSLENYDDIKKYQDNTTVTLKYEEVYKFSYKAVITINCVYLPMKSRARGFYVHSASKGVEVEDEEIIIYPKKSGFKATMLKGVKFDEIENVRACSNETKKTVIDMYRALRKQTIKTIEKRVKASSLNNSYVIRAIRFSDISLIKCMIPVYYIHCKKPGFDIKYIVNANSKKVYK